MERIYKHGDVAYAFECLITIQRASYGRQRYHTEIRAMLGKHEQVFGQIPPGKPPDRGFEHTIELEEGAKPMILKGLRMRMRKKLMNCLRWGISDPTLVSSLLQFF
jgi:hypothetical protein